MSNSDKKDSKWIKLEPVPQDYITFGEADMAMINDHEFIFAPRPESYGIIKYNVHNNEWKKFIKYPDKFELKYFKMATCPNDEKLYLLQENGKMTIIDMKSQKFEIISDAIQDIDEHCFLTTNDGNIHLIGGYFQMLDTEITGHRIWNQQKQSFERINIFPNYCGILSAKTIYVPSKQIIVLIGGYIDDHETDYPPLDKILIYSLFTQCWTSINNVHFNGLNEGTHELVLTSNEKYIIISGYGEDEDKIAVLEISDNDEYILRESDIVPPEVAYHYLLRTGGSRDNILVCGYINQLFRTKQFETLMISNDIIQLITSWFSVEMIHWIKRHNSDQCKDHFGIIVDDILSSRQ